MTKIRRNLPNNQYLAAILANSPSTTNVFATMADLAGLGGGTTGTANRIEHTVKYAQQINIGQAVYVSSADGTNMIVSKADNSAEATSSKTIGLVTATGNTNFQGSVVTEGLLAGLDTSLATIGDAVWLGTNGNLIFWHYGLTTKPVAPDHLVFIGIVTRVNANNGEIFVKVQNGYELDEIHDVSLPAYIDKGVLYRDVATNLWKTDSIANLLGQANATTSGYLSELDWSLFNSKQPALSGGIANRTVVWDSASTLRNGAIIDTGTFVSINMATTNSAILEVDGGNGATQGGIYGQGNLYGVKGYSYNGSGVFGNSSGGIGVRGESTGTLPSNIGVSGSAIALIIPGSPISLQNIGGKFYAEGADANYAIQLVDGTEGIGKFLKSITSDGKANWSTISSSDVTTALGFTPANIAGASFTGNISALNLLGSNTGDETTSTIKTKLGAASAGQDGYLTQADWSTFNGKQNALSYTPADKAGDSFTGNITANNLSGTNTGDETTATIKTKLGTASALVDGYLLSTDWTIFNNKVATTRNISTTAPLQGGGDLSANRTLSITQAGVTTDGYLSTTDWNIFNNKQNTLGFTPENISNKSTDVNLGTSNTLYPTQNAVKVYTDNLLGNANALVYKGVVDCSTNPNYPAANAGELYIVSVAGKIGGASGITVEAGDMLICNTDNTITGTQASVGTYWNVIQKNIDGAVSGPSVSTSNNVAFFDGITGKIIKDSGLTLSGTNTGDETTSTIKTKLGVASASADGYLSSTDWSTFNGKQEALVSTVNIKTINSNSILGTGNLNVQAVISLTTNGASGAATFDGSTLNIPQYTGGSGSATFDYGLANAMTTMTFL